MSQHSPQKWFNLEERFFAEVDHELVKRLRGQMETAETAHAIMDVTGINDEHLAEEMAELSVTVDTLSAFRLAPLVAVAWADDRVEENERYVILRAAEKSGIKENDPSFQLLKAWTTKRPSHELLDAWCEYAQALSKSLADSHRETLRKEVLSQVKAVAEAAGGLLGFGSISPSEHAVIERIEKALA
jgi:hypothetical protein